MTEDVVIDASGKITFWGRTLKERSLTASMQQAVDKEEETIARLRGVGGNAPALPTQRPLVIAVHANAPWSKVVALLKARPQGFDDRVRWLFRLPPRVEEPTPTWVSKSTEGQDLRGRINAIATASAKVAEGCPSYQALLAKMSASPAATAAHTLEGGIEGALIDCKCKVDVAALHDLLYLTLHTGDPAGFIETRIPHDGKGHLLSARRQATFKAVAPDLQQAAASGSALSVAAR
jgi:hypothetical protein